MHAVYANKPEDCYDQSKLMAYPSHWPLFVHALWQMYIDNIYTIILLPISNKKSSSIVG
jgi:hypothetical protein